jgi:hypothetical protein
MKTSILLVALTLTTGLTALKAADAPPAKPYPLTTCFISGEKLGEMGKPVDFVYEGQEIKLCCGSCRKEFDKDPTAGMKKFQAVVNSKASGAQ